MAKNTNLTNDGRNTVDSLGRSNVNKRGPKARTTPDGRSMVDTLGRSNVNKRGPKTGV
jgi:hypothetical protein